MSDKRAQIIEWFDAPVPSFSTMGVLSGFVVTIIGFCLIQNSTTFGLVMLAIGVLIIVSIIISYNSAKKRFEARPSDSQMDQWLEEDLAELAQKSLAKMGIDDSECVSEAVTVTGPRLWDRANAVLKYRKGKDDILRFSPIDSTIINFTQNQLLVYNCVIDITTGKTLNENTDEYFYTDVVSVSTKTESKTVNYENHALQLNAAESFTLTTSGGTSISVLLRDPKLAQIMGGGNIPVTHAEKAIQAVRKMLREKKTNPVKQ